MKAATGSEPAGAAGAGALLTGAAAAGAGAGAGAAADLVVAAAGAAAGACAAFGGVTAAAAAGALASLWILLAALVVVDAALGFAAPLLDGAPPSKLNCTTSPLSSTHALTWCGLVGFWVLK